MPEEERMITVMFYTCTRCDHKWSPRGKEKPVVCPKCRSAYWDRPRKEEKEVSA